MKLSSKPFHYPTLCSLLLSSLGLGMLSACQSRPSLPLRSAVTSQRTYRSPLQAQSAAGPSHDQHSDKVALGLRLFFDPKLSANQQMSCASCHQPGKGFSNGEPTAAGVTGARGQRNVPSIYGMRHQQSFFWDGRALTLEEQALGPIQNPIEMNESLENVMRKLEASPYYRQRFRELYGGPASPQSLADALAVFQRAVELKPSAYDRFLAGDPNALSPQQLEGMSVFGRRAHCSTCHSGPQFSDQKFHNLGVGFDKPNPDPGRSAISGNSQDYGAFKTPGLRQLASTGPYMHDGSQRSLEEVIEFYDRGGHPNPNLDPEMNALNLLPEEKADLLAFLLALQSPGDNLKELARLPGVKLPTEPLPLSLAQLP